MIDVVRPHPLEAQEECQEERATASLDNADMVTGYWSRVPDPHRALDKPWTGRFGLR